MPKADLTPSQRRARDYEIWKEVAAGVSRELLAERYSMSVANIHRIVANQRSRIQGPQAVELREDLAAELNAIRDLVAEVLVAEPAPVTTDKGEYIYMPGEDGEKDTTRVVRDYKARLDAAKAMVRVHERLSRLLGLDAPTQTVNETTVNYTVEGIDPEALR